MRRLLVVSTVYVDPANRGKLRALAAQGLDVTVAVPQRWREPALGRVILTPWERQSGVEVFPIPCSHPGDDLECRFGRRPLLSLLHDKRPELIQIEAEPDAALTIQVSKAARRLGIPVVVFAWDGASRPGAFARWRRRRVLKRLVGALAGSAATRLRLLSERADLPVAVVPQLGVTVPTQPDHLPHEGLAVGYVGRLVAHKGVDSLLQALALNREAAWHLTVVGDGPEREKLERLATDLRLAARIRWRGALPPEELAAMWQSIDVLVLAPEGVTTRSEQSGHVLGEAMAHEVAVVVSETGVLPEIVDTAGVVIPPGDAGALAEVLRRLGDAAVRLPLVQAARARALRHYSDEAVAEKMLKFLNELTEQPRGMAPGSSHPDEHLTAEPA
ncbi:MAG TPA: glycosyltransferase [Gemmatimonadales bacterium]